MTREATSPAGESPPHVLRLHPRAVDDAACLAMDLERLSAPDLAQAFLSWYLESAGDPVVPSLIHHYVAYRAFARVKVACLRHEAGDAQARDEARQLVHIAQRHLRAGATTLVLIGGPPASGRQLWPEAWPSGSHSHA